MFWPLDLLLFWTALSASALVMCLFLSAAEQMTSVEDMVPALRNSLAIRIKVGAFPAVFATLVVSL